MTNDAGLDALKLAPPFNTEVKEITYGPGDDKA